MSKQSKLPKSRIFIGILLFSMFLLLNWLGSFTFSLLVLTFSWLASKEFNGMCRKINIYPSRFWTRVLIALFILVPLLINQDKIPNSVFVCQGLLMALSSTIIMSRMFLRTEHVGFADISASLWCIMYLGFLPSFYIWIRGLEHGFAFLIILIASVSFNDIFAMLGGRAFGSTPLSPQISPKKTVEGSLIGLAAGTASFYFLVKAFGLGLNFDSVVWSYLLPRVIDLNVTEAVIICGLGLVIAVITQIGDLLESLFKREVGVKDSGNILKSHGGMMDRLDGHYFSAWIAYFIFYYLIV